MCEISKRCHVNATGHKTFGTKFSPELVRRLASSSVMIVTRTGIGEGAGKRTLLASGTLIAPNIVLCAAHSLQGNTEKDLSFIIFYECDAKSAPTGAFSDTPKEALRWRSCQTFANKRQGVCVKILEAGSDDFDYALLAVKWIDAKNRYVSETIAPIHKINRNADPDVTEQIEDFNLTGAGHPADDPTAALKLSIPRSLTIPAPGSELTSELLLIGHPYSRHAGEVALCQPTQASVGTVLAKEIPDPTAPSPTGRPRNFSASNFDTYYGASGGGIFNLRGELVGILKGIIGKDGSKIEGKIVFLNLFATGTAIFNLFKAGKLDEKQTGKRLRQWLSKGPPRLQGDPDANITFEPSLRF